MNILRLRRTVKNLLFIYVEKYRKIGSPDPKETVVYLEKYRKIGSPDPKAEGRGKLCSFDIHGSSQKNGELYSVTYPGPLIR